MNIRKLKKYIYVVMEYDWGEGFVRAVFSSDEKAIQYVKDHCRSADLTIYRFIIDEEKEE